MSTQRWPLVARGAVLACVLGAAVVAFLGPPAGPPAAAAGYVCPMHPEVRRSGAGDCPVCGMALIPVVRAESADRASGETRPALPPGSVEVARRRILTERRSAPAWVDAARRVQALVPEEEVPTLGSGEHAEFRPGADPAPVPVRRSTAAAVRHDDLTWRVEFEPVPGSALSVGTAGWLVLADRPRPALLLPSSAVLPTPEGPTVLVSVRGGAAVQRRPVRLGQAPEGLVMVLSGVEENEPVVVRGAFFLDAERRLGSNSGTPVR